jgi:hypothetical protein
VDVPAVHEITALLILVVDAAATKAVGGTAGVPVEALAEVALAPDDKAAHGSDAELD